MLLSCADGEPAETKAGVGHSCDRPLATVATNTGARTSPLETVMAYFDPRNRWTVDSETHAMTLQGLSDVEAGNFVNERVADAKREATSSVPNA